MNKLGMAVLAMGGLLVGSVGCGQNDHGRQAAPETVKEPPAGSALKAGAPFDARLLELARTYKSFGVVDDELRSANVLCMAYAIKSPWRFSASKDQYSHGQKLYLLYANQTKDKTYIRQDDQYPPGFAVVKEAWIPEEDRGQADKDKENRGRAEKFTFTIRYDAVMRDGKRYYASRKFGLFIMYKTDTGTPDTDDGWVYGTVTPDGEEVMSAGRVENCMECHRRAPHDRLFGLPQ